MDLLSVIEQQPGMLRLIVFLSSDGEMTLMELRDGTGIPLNQIYSCVDKAEKLGLVKTGTNQKDLASGNKISLTDKGRAASRKIIELKSTVLSYPGEVNSTITGTLDHVELNVSDISRTRDFWSRFLSMLEYFPYQEWDSGFSYIRDGTYIVFSQTGEKYRDIEYNRKRTGLNHLAFSMASADDVDMLREFITEYGLNELYSDRYPKAAGEEFYALFFEDPDRIKVEVKYKRNDGRHEPLRSE